MAALRFCFCDAVGYRCRFSKPNPRERRGQPGRLAASLMRSCELHHRQAWQSLARLVHQRHVGSRARPADIAMPELAVTDFVSEKQPENKLSRALVLPMIPASARARKSRFLACARRRSHTTRPLMESVRKAATRRSGPYSRRASGRHLPKPTLQ
jgi:hypothetical protein